MLYFTASWCENCKLLDELSFKDERVQEKLKEYSLIKIDLSKADEESMKIMKRFKVFAPPVLIFFDQGKQKAKLTGLIEAAEYLKAL